MVVGGLMLGLWALRAWWAFMLFLAGIAIHLLGLLPALDILQA